MSTLLLVGGAAFLLGCGKPSVLVVGLDGANWIVVDTLIDAGHLPTIGGLVRGGVSAGLDCTPAQPASSCFCPPVWVSIATGQPASVHGSSRFLSPSYERRVKAIWNVVSDHAGSATISSWRGTWPPESDVDFVFTEHGLDNLGAELYDTWAEVDLPARDELDTHFKPLNLAEQLAMTPGPDDPEPSFGILARDRAAMEGLLRLNYLRGPPEPWERETELTMVLLHGGDKVAHLLWDSVQDVMFGPFDPAPLLDGAAAWDGPVLLPGPFGWGPMAGPYLEADEFLEALLLSRHYDYVVFVSDHGMTRNLSPGLAGHHDPPAVEAHTGIFSVTGPGVRQGVRLDDVTVLDIAPTLAYLLGLPVAEDLPGRVIVEAFTPDRLAVFPIVTVPTWE